VARRPRILLLITLAETGGAQTYVAGLLPALVGRFDVLVGAHGEGPLRDAALAAGARFIPLRHVRRDLHVVHDLLGAAELALLMRRERPDIVHANSSKAGLLGRVAAAITRVPIRIFTVHGWAFKAYSGAASTLYRWADRLMSPITTVTICVSQRERSAGLAAQTCRAERTVVIPTAVDADATRPARRGGKPPRIVAVGRLAAPKDPVTLVRALAAVHGAPFSAQIVGDGPERPAVEREIRVAGLEHAVELTGERHDVPQLLADADVFVLSSRSEGAPISILEAMAAGLPVVASNVGGVAEIVEDGATGVLVPPGEPTALAAAIAPLLADATLRVRLGDAGRTRVRERFDVMQLQRAHVDLYTRELLRAGRPAPMP
jgi:glycosyltransferase involved in cell wall biosynthesis